MGEGNRALTDHERRLVRWMLEHGGPAAAALLPQVELAEVMPWKCPCGCANIDFEIKGRPRPTRNGSPIVDYQYGGANGPFLICLHALDGTLTGLEVTGFVDGAPKTLPEPEELRPLGGSAGE